jgi:hypothetical protein
MASIRAIALCVIIALSALVAGATAAVAAANEGELVNAKGEPFKGTISGKGGELQVQTKGGLEMKCTSFTVSENVVLKGCKGPLSTKCNSKGAKAEEIVLTATGGPAKSQLFRNKATGKLLVATEFTETFEFECGGVTSKAKGGFLSPVPVEKTLQTSYTFTAKEAKGIQEPLEFENEAKEKIKRTLEAEIGKGGKFEQAGIAFAEEVTYSEAVEFR